MAATVDNATAFTSAATGTVTLTTCSNLAVGDWLFAVVQPSGAVTVPTGWTQAGVGTFNVYYRKVDLTEAVSYAFAGNGGSTTLVGMMFLVKGANLNYPFDAAIYQAQANASSASITAPTISATRSVTDLLVNVYASNTASAITVPGTQTAKGSTVATGRAVVLGFETLAAYGATGTRVATGSAAINHGVSILISPPLAPLTVMASQSNPAFTVTGWIAGQVSGGGLVDTNPLARMMPFWLADTGIGPASQSPGSANMTQLGLGAACTAMLSANVAGTFSGTVRVNSVPVVGCRVCLYWRATGQMIKTTRTAADGTYSFSGLDTTSASDNAYFAVAIDPNGLAVQYNSGIYDRLIPG